MFCIIFTRALCVCVCVCVYIYVCVCVCVYVTYILSSFYATTSPLPTSSVFASPSISQLYADFNVALAIHQYPSIPFPTSLASPRHVRPVISPLIYPHLGASNAITPPSVRSGHCRMRAPLSQGLQRSRMLDLTIASDILAHTKPHFSEYSRFSL